MIDSFGPNRCRKSENYDGVVLNQLAHTPDSGSESPLYSRRVNDILQHCSKNVMSDSFEDFLVDQDRQFQNTQNSRVDTETVSDFFGHIFTSD